MSLEAKHACGSKEKDTLRSCLMLENATGQLEQHPDIQFLAAAAVK
jgi:hypothetical protein